MTVTVFFYGGPDDGKALLQTAEFTLPAVWDELDESPAAAAKGGRYTLRTAGHREAYYDWRAG